MIRALLVPVCFRASWMRDAFIIQRIQEHVILFVTFGTLSSGLAAPETVGIALRTDRASAGISLIGILPIGIWAAQGASVIGVRDPKQCLI